MAYRYRRGRRSRSRRRVRRLIRRLILGTVLVLLAAVLGGYYTLRYFDLTPRQFALASMEKSGVGGNWGRKIVSPSSAFAQHRLDGLPRSGHPRILLSGLAGASAKKRLATMKERSQAYKDRGIVVPEYCAGGGVMGQAACWFVTGDGKAARTAIRMMVDFKPNRPNTSGQYGNGWKVALAYDLLAGYEGLDKETEKQVREKIRQTLRDTLVLLNGDSASLWHGRATLAAQAWLCAVVLDIDTDEERDLITQAQAHFLNLVRALELTEAWPEGYSYWINNRALVLALGGAAYLNGLKGAERAGQVRSALNRTGLWHLYATRPDNRIEGLGDEGPRVDLKDETRPVIDLLAQITRNRSLARYSRFLGELHGEESYFKAHRWGFPLFNDPELLGLTELEEGGLPAAGKGLPHAELFGVRALNLAYIRSGWSPEDTFISFRAGASFTHHGHYDAGHFTLFKGAPLAITSGTYGDFSGEHRLNYAIRTLAKNSLLVLRPDEEVQPGDAFDLNVAAGGQRITMPTGSALLTPAHWAENLGAGKHLEGGRLLAFHNEEGRYVYIAADLTPAYNNTAFDSGGVGGKVKSVLRELLYLYPEDRLLIHDRVVSTRATYRKKWLLHTVTRPEVAAPPRVLKGTADNGILESRAVTAWVANGRGRLRLDRLYPEDAVMRLVGGPDYRFYAEVDGDDADLDGRNMAAGANLKPWFDTGMWRIEVQPAGDRLSDHFLLALSPSLDEYRPEGVHPLTLEETEDRGAATPESLIVFVDRRSRGRLSLEHAEQKYLYVLGLPSLVALRVNGEGYAAGITANDAGVAVVDLTAFEPGRIELGW